MKKLTHKDFVENARKVHGDRYSYPDSYKGSDTKIAIHCYLHGDFQQRPYDHTGGKGCRQCGIEAAAASKQSTTASFVEKAKKVHGDKYDYSTTKYTFAKEKLTIICPTHGEFLQLASGHLSGYGCRECTDYGKGRVDMEKPCSLYYLFLPDFGYYKIGITSQSIEHRYRTSFDKSQFTVVFSKQYPTGREAYNKEQEIIKTNQHITYKGPKLLHSGNTEMFTHDIFKGDYNEFK